MDSMSGVDHVVDSRRSDSHAVLPAAVDVPRPLKRARALLSSTLTTTTDPSVGVEAREPALAATTQMDAFMAEGERLATGYDPTAQGWQAYTRAHDWTPRRLVPHYDADIDQHHHEIDVTHEHALWCAYVRSGSRVPSTDLDVVFDDVIAFAADFIDDGVYYDMESLEPGVERRSWIAQQSPVVQADRARRSRLATVVGEALEREDDALSMSASPSWSGEGDIEAYASDDAASSHSS